VGQIRATLGTAEATIRAVTERDWPAITAVFNYFVANSLAAYPEKPVSGDAFKKKHLECPDFPFVVAELGGVVVGFAYLLPFHHASTMKRSAVLTYFIHPESTGEGLGRRFLDLLIDEGRNLGVTNFLAHISSANQGSIRFHARHGFTECGRFLKVGVKAGQTFDMVWMQRIEE